MLWGLSFCIILRSISVDLEQLLVDESEIEVTQLEWWVTMSHLIQVGPGVRTRQYLRRNGTPVWTFLLLVRCSWGQRCSWIFALYNISASCLRLSLPLPLELTPLLSGASAWCLPSYPIILDLLPAPLSQPELLEWKNTAPHTTLYNNLKYLVSLVQRSLWFWSRRIMTGLTWLGFPQDKPPRGSV